LAPPIHLQNAKVVKSMNKESYGLVQIIIAIILVIIIVAATGALFSRPEPAITAEVEINPKECRVSQTPVLSLKITNNDQSSRQNVHLRLVTNSLVHIFLGASELPEEQPNSGNFFDDIALQAGQMTEQPYSVQVASLPQGIASQEFSITAEMYIDNSLVVRQKVILTVRE
jgi:hypothetical protein